MLEISRNRLHLSLALEAAIAGFRRYMRTAWEKAIIPLTEHELNVIERVQTLLKNHID
jgi:predicted phage tail protein